MTYASHRPPVRATALRAVALSATASSAWAGWPKAVLALLKEGAERTTPERQDHDQWTVVKRRLAARSRVNRPSCQGVR